METQGLTGGAFFLKGGDDVGDKIMEAPADVAGIGYDTQNGDHSAG